MIEARVVKGFRDALPQDEGLRQAIITKLSQAFRLNGYQAIDTPILEYTQTLLGKSGGETEKQIFRFKDAGERDVAMRFDLTVPLARYVAQHKELIGLPFKRYHIAKVWRGEKPQRGRFREFYQCDFDLVGASGMASDLDILLTAQRSLHLLGVENFVIEVNHRTVLRNFLTELGLAEANEAILRSIDKVDKVGWAAVESELLAITDAKQLAAIAQFITMDVDNTQTLDKMERMSGNSCEEIGQLRWIVAQFEALGMAKHIKINPKITRGLDYYTGMVFETFLNEDRSLGSVCSGGRYANLLALYTKEAISGVGGSIGLDRLLACEQVVNQLSQESQSGVLIYYNEQYYLAAQQLLLALHQQGVSAEVYPEDKKVEAQTKYALRKGLVWVVFVENGAYTLRNLERKESMKGLAIEQVVAQFTSVVQGG